MRLLHDLSSCFDYKFHSATITYINLDRVPLSDFPRQDFLRQSIDHIPLDGALQRACTKSRIESSPRKPFLRSSENSSVIFFAEMSF